MIRRLIEEPGDDPQGQERESHPDLFEYAFKLEGLLRHASRHAAGVVISDVPLAEVVPLYADKERADGAMAITQYSMKGVEEIGLIKFDFLALKNLTLIVETLNLVRVGGKEPPDSSVISSGTAKSSATSPALISAPANSCRARSTPVAGGIRSSCRQSRPSRHRLCPRISRLRTGSLGDRETGEPHRTVTR